MAALLFGLPVPGHWCTLARLLVHLKGTEPSLMIKNTPLFSLLKTYAVKGHYFKAHRLRIPPYSLLFSLCTSLCQAFTLANSHHVRFALGFEFAPFKKNRA